MAAAKQVFCDVCEVSLPSASLLPTHIKGKKHQRLLKLRQGREKSCKKSIYVRGFQNSGSVEEELTDYFSTYGKVSNIFVDKDKGVFAIVEFADEESVTSVLQQESLPLLNENRLTVKERTVNKANLQYKTQKMKKNKADGSQRHLHRLSQNQEIAEFVPEELVNKIKSSVCTVQEQVNLLMQQLCLTEEDIKLRKLVCQLLQEVFYEVYPEASVVPFGSTVSGVGWEGSDLDVCLLTPSQQDDTAIDYSLVIDVLRSFAPGCINIIPVLTAKCPLIKFTHQPSGLSCDLSVNNRLGVANSDLLRCYMSLDPRVPQLVFIVRAWARAKGLTIGKQLSNYALTLMVLYFLQMRTPPVIPSLQQGFDSWIKELSCLRNTGDNDHHSLVIKQLESDVIDGWECSFFKDTHRLSMSQNDTSLSHLLEEFFCYFSTEFNFSGCVVNIRTGCSTSTAFVLEELKGAKYSGSDTTASFGLNEDNVGQSEDFVRNESSADECHQKAQPSSSTASSAMKTKCGKRVEFKISPLCVQDPFELTHNLTQNVPASLLKHIVELMEDAHKICSEINNEKEKKISLLDLLTVCKTTKKRKSTISHSFFVSFQEAGALKLATSKSVFLFIVETLEKEFGLKCERKGNSAKRQRSCEQLSETPLSKRQRIDCGQCSVMAQDTQVSKESQDTDSVNRTSGCVMNSTNIDKQENVKKTEHTDDSGEVFSLICTAFENTWTHSRRERRKHKLSQNQMKEREKTEGEEIKIPADDSQVKSGTVSQEICEASSSSTRSASIQFEGSKNVNSIASPILVFELRVEGSPQNTPNVAGCTVVMKHVESQDFQLFGNFFSAFKRHFMGLLQNKQAWS